MANVSAERLQSESAIDAALKVAGQHPARAVSGTSMARAQWLGTTPLLGARSSSTSSTDILHVRLYRELQRRALILPLALIAWKKRHGEYPARLDQLDETWRAATIDPYTGQEFEYFPKGRSVRMAVAGALAAGMGGMRPMDTEEQPVDSEIGKPLFQSAGPQSLRIDQPPGLSNKNARTEFVLP